jgi:hypothetical protein
MTGPWTIIETTEYSAWFLSLSESQQDAINDRIQKLREKGPLLTRPYADHIKGSEISNLKELRIPFAEQIYKRHLEESEERE